jgi:2-iminobutanoate/2-iminopropanoate deaminase
MAKIEPYAAPGTWDSPTYAQAVKVTGAQTILYISGQVAYDDQGNPAYPGDFKAQARSAFQALKAQVEAGGGTMTDIAKMNFYLTDARHMADFRQIRAEFFGKKTTPASTLVIVEALFSPVCLIEVEAVVVL